MKNFLLESQQKAERITLLTEFIQDNKNAKELKRALAVKMVLQGEPYSQITKLLGMHKSSITYWKQRFESQGLKGIKLGYKGSKSYLTTQNRAEVIAWLKSRDYWNLEELVTYLDEYYSVIYQAKQSYYQLLSSASISWKKSQKINPKSDPELVKKKREEIQNFLAQHQVEIQTEQLVVMFLDECHLLWGDVCGYVWAAAFGGKLPPETCLGKTNIRIEVPLPNQKKRQTYYGALNYQTKEFISGAYSAGNGVNNVKFMKKL